MPKPRSLEDWADKCTHKPASVRVDSWRSDLLCYDCARAYANQRVQATLKHVVTEISKFSRLPAQTDTAGIVRGILSAIRALKVEP